MELVTVTAGDWSKLIAVQSSPRYFSLPNSTQLQSEHNQNKSYRNTIVIMDGAKPEKLVLDWVGCR